LPADQRIRPRRPRRSRLRPPPASLRARRLLAPTSARAEKSRDSAGSWRRDSAGPNQTLLQNEAAARIRLCWRFGRFGWRVDASVAIAQAAGVDETTIGLTIVAAGTSLPEVATSLAATLRGERDIAVGNIVGSGVFNILGIAGLAAIVSPGGLAFPESVVAFDLPLMVAVAVACLPVVAGDHRISRPVGALFLFAYAAYVAYLVLAAQSHQSLEPFSWLMLEFAVPLTAAGIVAYLYRRIRARRTGEDAEPRAAR
jgi:cation:H+ antiporter